MFSQVKGQLEARLDPRAGDDVEKCFSRLGQRTETEASALCLLICVSCPLVSFKENLPSFLKKGVLIEDPGFTGDLSPPPSLPAFLLAVYFAVIILSACQQEHHPNGKSKALFDHFDEARLWSSSV